MFVDEIESIKSMFDSLVTVSDRDKQRALELVLQSRTFVRSEQLRAFLRYVCSMEIEGRGEQITEYRIAVDALGRSQDYTTTEDSAVRNRAHAMRIKLEELYAKELPDAPVRIDFVKGSRIAPDLRIRPEVHLLVRRPRYRIANSRTTARQPNRLCYSLRSRWREVDSAMASMYDSFLFRAS
jgi:hypothetical protein